ncbi:hypothetical protein [Luteolibacter sp. LG18]|uniref:hypothetical protein n=1 Tax=Luteolibacter sp. LG18 TaxID=2819286 RepID=UPI0030C76535
MTDPAAGVDRELVAESINRAMERFPLILEILEELSRAGIPHPGDVEIRHGCERGLTSMLAALARIPPAAISPDPAGEMEEKAGRWLLGEMPRRLVDAGRLERFEQFIGRLLP